MHFWPRCEHQCRKTQGLGHRPGIGLLACREAGDSTRHGNPQWESKAFVLLEKEIQLCPCRL